MLKQILKTILPNKIQKILSNFYHTYITKYSQNSYAQEGEDLILLEIFDKKLYRGGGFM